MSRFLRAFWRGFCAPLRYISVLGSLTEDDVRRIVREELDKQDTEK